jgi:hypothetical protein
MRTATLLTVGALLATVGAGVAVGRVAADHDEVAGPITRADLDHGSITTVYDALRQMRPAWLSSVFTEDGNRPVVYIELPCTQVTCLRWLAADKAEEVRFVASEGVGPARGKQGNGAIVVRLRMHLPLQGPHANSR